MCGCERDGDCVSVSVSFCLGGGGGGQTGVGEDWFVMMVNFAAVYVHHLCMHMQHCMHVHVISARTHKFTNTIEGLLYC